MSHSIPDPLRHYSVLTLAICDLVVSLLFHNQLMGRECITMKMPNSDLCKETVMEEMV